jgi:hypothetical protein
VPVDGRPGVQSFGASQDVAAGMCQAVLAARLGDEERVRASLINLAQIDNIRSPPLMDRTIARIALSGVLAPIWRITPQMCEEDARAIEDAWRERLKVGRFVHVHLTWSQLLRKLSQAADSKFKRKRATAAAIRSAEKRLGVGSAGDLPRVFSRPRTASRSATP